jgi:hypothetical protein
MMRKNQEKETLLQSRVFPDLKDKNLKNSQKLQWDHCQMSNQKLLPTSQNLSQSLRLGKSINMKRKTKNAREKDWHLTRTVIKKMMAKSPRKRLKRMKMTMTTCLKTIWLDSITK